MEHGMTQAIILSAIVGKLTVVRVARPPDGPAPPPTG